MANNLRWINQPGVRRIILPGAIGGLMVLVGVNIGLGAAYAQRSYPNTVAYGMQLGGLTAPQAKAKLETLQQSYQLELKSTAAAQTYKAAELGVNFADAASVTALTHHAWYDLPVSHLWPRRPSWQPAIDQTKLASVIAAFAAAHVLEPADARPEFAGDKFSVTAAKPGTKVDQAASERTVAKAIRLAERSSNLNLQEIAPTVSNSQAEAGARAANELVTVELHIVADGKTITPSRADMAAWLNFAPGSGTKAPMTVTIDKAKIAGYVSGLAQQVNVAPVARVVTVTNGSSSETTAGKNGTALNQDDLVNQLATALNAKRTATVTASFSSVAYSTLTRQTAPAAPKSVTYSYCVALKGVDESERGGFTNEAARVYADVHGWNMGGKINFVHNESSCSFTLWLAAANLVPSFDPAGCSEFYSCRVGRNVVINYDRYTGASPSWTLSLAEYHDMVISHETGHWLGFNHLYCPGPGQLAPVMQQQSISLQGCAANPWPTTGEKQTAARARGLSYP